MHFDVNTMYIDVHVLLTDLLTDMFCNVSLYCRFVHCYLPPAVRLIMYSGASVCVSVCNYVSKTSQKLFDGSQKIYSRHFLHLFYSRND